MATPVRMNLAEDYHENSKYSRYSLPRLLARHAAYPAWLAAQPFQLRPEKQYPGSTLVGLPRPRAMRTSLGALLWRRRSVAPTEGALGKRDLATLLWCLQGQRSDGHRTNPSAGALYPLEVYAVVHDVEGIEPGRYHYSPSRHALERISGPLDTGKWYLERPFPGAVHLVVCAVLPRLDTKYDQRAYRFALLEAGHATQTLLLGATALGIAALPVGGFYDDLVHDDLALDGIEETVLYVIPAGRKPG